MAKINDLVARIPDPILRQDIEAAIAEMKSRQRFGLVFEEHIPETTALYGLPVQPGSFVQRRDDRSSTELYRVRQIGPDGQAVVEDAAGVTAHACIADLLVVKRFGDPIYPALTRVSSVLRGPSGKPHHAVINGENFHALQLLVYLYEGQVDCIYIDPPYNTGAKDWKYNNRYVDSNDAWRHSKWLSFMEKRLRLAKRLLKDDGVLIVTIDEHEVHHLGMLLERVFPDFLRHTVTMVINPKGTGKLNFARVDEYAIFCVPNTGKSIIAGAPVGKASKTPSQKESLSLEAEETDRAVDDDEDDDDEDDECGAAGPPEAAQLFPDEDKPGEQASLPFPRAEIDKWELRHARRRGGESSYRHQRWHQFYPIYIDPVELRVVRAGESLELGKEPDLAAVDGLRPLWPIDSEGNHRCWRFVPETMQTLIDHNRVVMGRYNAVQDSWTLNIWERRPLSKKLKTVWWETAHDAGTHGTTLLYKLIGSRDAFPFPKSVYAVRDSLAAVVRNRPQALILDFFAGSGTTLHATCLLNADDDGARRCILVTNNQVAAKVATQLERERLYRGDASFEVHGIFEQATRPRCEAVITGQRADGTAVLGKHINGRPLSDGFPENADFYRLDYLDPDEVDLGRQFEAILPSLWLAAGGVGQPEIPQKGAAFTMPADSTYAVLFRESRFRQFLEALEKRPEITHVWFVTNSEEAYAEMCTATPRGIATSMLYRDYLRNFQINTERNL